MPSAVIVGAGVLGASVADRLARSGWAVVLVERWVPGHVRAASGGESRLARCSHGSDEWHTASAWRALSLWRELGEGALVECGVAWLARSADGWEAASEGVLRSLGVPVQRVAASDLFPSVREDDLAFCLFEPAAGVLRAREATRALVRRAVAHGARLELGVAARPDGAAVVLGDGRRLEADRVVWACGAWLPGLFPNVLDLRITQQDIFFFGTPDGSWAGGPGGVPGWADYDGALYGTGDLDGEGFKLAPDVDGPPLDVDAAREPLASHAARARDALAHRFPALASAPQIGARVCQYELTGDGRFVCAPHPEAGDRVWLLGGGSGHAFKHGPALAERVVQWLAGTTEPDPLLGLGPRTGGRAFRTAGAR